MSGTNFKTENNTFRKLLGNGLTYTIPRFQRDYSWTDTEWDDLWTDIQLVQSNSEPAHYMGYLVLQSADDKLFEVIDGQQRLTTLSIIVLAILRNLQKLVDQEIDTDNNKARMDQIRSSYIGYLDPVTLIPRSKLTLNRNNDHYYQGYLVPLKSLPVRGFKASEHAMRKASDWFERRILEYLNDQQLEDLQKGAALARLLEGMADKLFFTVITVSDELNAYTVFETLNARGVRLSATDLLKNYLFSVLHKGGVDEREMSALDDRWERLVSRLGESDLPDFLRVHWMSRHGLIRQPELFKTIRKQITTREHVFSLLNDLDSDVDPYLALTSPESAILPPVARQNAQLLKLFRVKQPFALLVAARRILGDADYQSLLRVIVVISFRYNVIGSQQAGEQERVYSRVAVGVSSGSISTLQAIVDGLRNIYPNDDSFRASFASKELKTTDSKNNRIVKYLLAEIERQSHQDNVDFEAPAVSVEHILPQNPEDGWGNVGEHEFDALLYRLGNMMLLESGINKDIGNRTFEDKRAAYNDSQFATAKSIGHDFAQWGATEITHRQNSMAAVATSIWRIGQFH
jgi:hypothetical protein